MIAAARTPRTRRKSNNFAFLNVPYDKKFEALYIAYIVGLCGFGLKPRATVEIPGSERRLEKIYRLIRQCRYSFHDLSRVELDRSQPPFTPRFNMPFELGLAVAHAKNFRGAHQWFVFETVPHRLKKSLSDVDGTDAYVHSGAPKQVLVQLSNALLRKRKTRSIGQLEDSYQKLRKAAKVIRNDSGNSLFGAKAFKDLVVAATTLAERANR